MEARTGWIIGISALLIVGGGSAAFYFIYWKPKKEEEKLSGGSSVPSGGNSGNENTSSGGGGSASTDYDALAAQVNKKISTGAVDSATMKLIQQLLANGYERKGNKIMKKGGSSPSAPVKDEGASVTSRPAKGTMEEEIKPSNIKIATAIHDAIDGITYSSAARQKAANAIHAFSVLPDNDFKQVYRYYHKTYNENILGAIGGELYVSNDMLSKLGKKALAIKLNVK